MNERIKKRKNEKRRENENKIGRDHESKERGKEGGGERERDSF